MSNILAEGTAMVGSQLRDFGGVAITYARGAQSVDLQATVGRSEFQTIAPDSGLVVDAEARDYLIDAADLILGGAVVLPALGDTITEGDMVSTVTRLPDQPHYRFSDPGRTLLRVHTKTTTNP